MLDKTSPSVAIEELLLNLYRAAYNLSLVDFQNLALNTLQKSLPFDAAWWGLASAEEDDIHVHFSYKINLPEGSERLVNLTGGNNIVAHTCRQNIGQTINFDTELLNKDPSIAFKFSIQELNINQLLCTQLLDRAKAPIVWSIIALIRNSVQNPFTEEERLLKQKITPHLTQMMHINRFSQLTELRSRLTSVTSLTGIINGYGIVHTYEAGFGKLLRLEWPNWGGVLLPEEVRAGTILGKFVGNKLIIQFESLDAYTLVTLSKRSKLDLLSPRESVISAEFSKGNSYKDVAAQLNISPTTVRNHLRNIYQKLNISSKMELARLYSER